MKTERRILLGIITVFVVTVWVLVYGLFHLPSTADMRDYFAERRAAFERRNAEILRARAHGTPFDNGPDDEVGYRFIEIRREPSLVINYYTHQRGIGLGGYGTGIAYRESPPEKPYASIDAMLEAARAVEGFRGYGHLSGNWYYFFWEVD